MTLASRGNKSVELVCERCSCYLIHKKMLCDRKLHDKAVSAKHCKALSVFFSVAIKSHMTREALNAGKSPFSGGFRRKIQGNWEKTENSLDKHKIYVYDAGNSVIPYS